MEVDIGDVFAAWDIGDVFAAWDIGDQAKSYTSCEPD
jgi:hypothetical protein